jgi:hypothetical protein
MLPVKFNVPVPVWFIGVLPPEVLTELALPTIEAEFGVAPAYVTTVAPPVTLPCTTFAVSVTPFESVNVPPVVAPPLVSLRTSRQVADAVTATARLFEIAVSPAIGGPNPGAPAGVVDHVLVALKFPAATA